MRGAEATCNGILGAVSQFCKGNYQDDLALIALSVHATDAGRRTPGVAVNYQQALI